MRRNRLYNKSVALQKYKDKWNLNEYRFFVNLYYYKKYWILFIVSKNCAFIYDDCPEFVEILSLETLLKRLNEPKEIQLWEDQLNIMKFYSTEDFKEYMLIKKIAGI